MAKNKQKKIEEKYVKSRCKCQKIKEIKEKHSLHERRLSSYFIFFDIF